VSIKLKIPKQPGIPFSERELMGAEILFECLKKENVEYIFGYPGGAALFIYDALYKSDMTHILARHEQGAIHMAEGYARISGKPGVVIATSGPGATNLVTGLADAYMDSLPLVVFTGQVATTAIGTDAFQEADVLGITMPITKHNIQVRDTKELPRIIREAFYIASNGRPGPVLIDIPKDISVNRVKFDFPETVNIRGFKPTKVPNIGQIRKMKDVVVKAKKPLILAGAGVLHAKASEALVEYVNQTKIPVTNTLLGLGGFPYEHPYFLGMCGMHGTYTANMAIQESDLLISIGARFDDRVTGRLDKFAPNAKIVHIDIDPAEIGKNIKTEVPIVGDAKEALKLLLQEGIEAPDVTDWLAHLHDYQQEYPLWYEEDGVTLKPQKAIEELHRVTKGVAIVSTDVGQHQMWAAQYFGFNKPDTWISSGGLGTMGFGFPAAIGACFANKNLPVFAIVGDGGFLMNIQELATIAEYNIPVKTFIVNNASLGMVRQWQEIIYEGRYSESQPKNPDFAKVAESFGVKGIRVTNLSELTAAIEESLAHDGPVVLDVMVTPEENVYPMVCSGTALHEMIGTKKGS